MKKVRIASGRAFRSGPVGYTAGVDPGDDRVYVWDSVAGHWTLCHSLTPRQEAYIRARVASAGRSARSCRAT